MGARPTSDGLHTVAFPSGVTGVPVEVIENVTPLLVYRRELAIDSAGPGRFRGGCGQYMEVGHREGRAYTLGPLFDRTRVPAEGYSGGGQGARGAIRLSDGRELQDKSQVLIPGDVRFTLQLPGGGGFFDPFTRDPERVREDALDGLVSQGAAREQYGVALDPDTLAVDEAATRALRAGH